MKSRFRHRGWRDAVMRYDGRSNGRASTIMALIEKPDSDLCQPGYQPNDSPPIPAAAAGPVADWVHAIAPRYQLDPHLVLAVIAQESGFNRQARSGKHAQGLMQLIPATAARFGVGNPWDPKDNIRGGCAYLQWLLHRFRGDVALTLAAYNAGEAAVDRYGGIPPYRETRDYVQRILERYPKPKHPIPTEAAES